MPWRSLISASARCSVRPSRVSHVSGSGVRTSSHQAASPDLDERCRSPWPTRLRRLDVRRRTRSVAQVVLEQPAYGRVVPGFVERGLRAVRRPAMPSQSRRQSIASRPGASSGRACQQERQHDFHLRRLQVALHALHVLAPPASRCVSIISTMRAARYGASQLVPSGNGSRVGRHLVVGRHEIAARRVVGRRPFTSCAGNRATRTRSSTGTGLVPSPAAARTGNEPGP